MHEEMARLTDARMHRSFEEGRPPGTTAGSACVRARLRQSGGEGRGRTGAVWEAPGAALPNSLTYPSLSGLRDRPQEGCRTARAARAGSGGGCAPLGSRRTADLQLCGGRAARKLGRRGAKPGGGTSLRGSGWGQLRFKMVDRRRREEKRNTGRKSFISKEIKIEPSICTFGEEADTTTFIHHKTLSSVTVLEAWGGVRGDGRAHPRLGEGAKRRIHAAVVGKGVQGQDAAGE